MKRIVSLLIALLMFVSVMSLVACNNDKKEESKDGDAKTSSSVPEDLIPYATAADGSAVGYDKYEYDDQKRVTRHYTYDANGKLTGSLGYEYDDNENADDCREHGKNYLFLFV